MPGVRATTMPRNHSNDTASFVTTFMTAIENERVKAALKSLILPQELTTLISNEVTKQVDEIKNDAAKRDEEIAHLKSTISHLEKKLDEKEQRLESMIKKRTIKVFNAVDKQEQYSRRDSLRLAGLSEEQDEDLQARVLTVFNSTMGIEPQIAARDIARVHRLRSKKDQPRQIIIKFASYKSRASVFQNKKNLSDSGLSLNEDLTPTRAKALYVARKARREGKLQQAWTNDGRVIIRDMNGKVHQDVNEAFIRKIADKRERVPEIDFLEESDEEDQWFQLFFFGFTYFTTISYVHHFFNSTWRIFLILCRVC